MEKIMEEIKVSTDTDAGRIRLLQPRNDDYDDIIILHPSQVEIVITWLREALTELDSQAGA